MAFQLQVSIRTPAGETQRTFPRFPVLVGRKVGPGQCTLEDRSASKLHVTLDVRQGQLCLRDAASTNGTFVGGQRVEPDRWVPLGPLNQVSEFRIGEAVIRAEVVEDVVIPSSVSATLGGMIAIFEDPESRVDTRPRGAAEGPLSAAPTTLDDFASHQLETAIGIKANQAEIVERLAPACEDAISSVATLRRLIANALDATPPDERSRVCRELTRSFPQLLDDSGLHELFERNGVVSKRGTAAQQAVGAVALQSLYELATWYTGRDERFADAAAISSFVLRLRTTLDDFLLGYVPLLSGLNSFEDQMSIHGPASVPAEASSAAQVASELLDWRRDDVEPRARLRSSFAELMMHQVALLRGVMRGVKTLLSELSPAVIEASIDREAPARGALGRMFTRPDPWTAYKRRHSDLSDEENERFQLIFGSEFVSEYRQFTREGRADGREPERGG